jgi:hypothetical protein
MLLSLTLFWTHDKIENIYNANIYIKLIIITYFSAILKWCRGREVGGGRRITFYFPAFRASVDTVKLVESTCLNYWCESKLRGLRARGGWVPQNFIGAGPPPPMKLRKLFVKARDSYFRTWNAKLFVLVSVFIYQSRSVSFIWNEIP